MKQIYLLYINAASESSLDYSGLLQTNLLKVVPKLGLQYLHAVLHQHDFPAVLLDQEIEPLTLKILSDKFHEQPPLFVGIYSSERIRSTTIRFIQQLLAAWPRLMIIVGGPDYFSYESYLKAGCTFVCHGEGEKTIVEIAKYARGELALDALKGVYYRKGTEVVRTEPQELIDDLDRLPFPRREHLHAYADFHYLGMVKPYVHMITSRGCGCSCSYCSSPYIWGRRVRRRSIENILAEIDDLVGRCQIRYISFKDDRFFSNLAWLRTFCHALIERKYSLRFNCSACPSDFKNDWEEKIDLLKAAGCDALILGLQSTDKSILQKIHRNPDEVDFLKPVIAYANKVRLFTIVEFIFGLPGDTEQSLQQTISYVMKIKPYFIQFNRLMLFKGSELNALREEPAPFCALTTRQIKRIILKGYLRFYLHPQVFYKNIRYVLRHNPRWFVNARRVWLYPLLLGYNYFHSMKTLHR